MAYLDPDTVHVPTTGRDRATAWELVVADSLDALAKRPACSVRDSAAGTLPNNQMGFFTAELENYDTDAMHDTAVNNDRITALVSGRYLAWATVSIDGHADAGAINAEVFRLGFLRNGVLRDRDTRPLGASPIEVRASILGVIPMAAGDFLQLGAFQNSGAGAPVLLEEFGMLLVGGA